MKRQLPLPVEVEGGERKLLPTRNLPVAPAPYKPKPLPRKVKKIKTTVQKIRRREPHCWAGHDVPYCLTQDPYCCANCYRVITETVVTEEDYEDWEVDVEES